MIHIYVFVYIVVIVCSTFIKLGKPFMQKGMCFVDCRLWIKHCIHTTQSIQGSYSVGTDRHIIFDTKINIHYPRILILQYETTNKKLRDMYVICQLPMMYQLCSIEIYPLMQTSTLPLELQASTSHTQHVKPN